MEIGYRRGTSVIRGRHRNRLIERVGRLPAHSRRHLRLLASGRDHPSDVLARWLAPIPHVEWMHAVVGMSVPIHVSIGGIARELRLELLCELRRIGGFRQASMEELD